MKYRHIFISLLFFSHTYYGLGQTEYGDLEETYEVETEDDTEEDESIYYPTFMQKSQYLDIDTSYKSRYNGREYEYREPEEKETKSRQINFPNISIGPWVTFIFRALLVIAGLFIIYMLFRALQNVQWRKSEPNKPVSVSTQDEANLSSPDELDVGSLNAKLKNAVQAKEYRLATRYYFLIYIESLETKKAITYHKDKTNSDYLFEIQDKDTTHQFTKLSYLYEYVWYGKNTLDENSFEVVSKTFSKQLEI